MSITDEIIEDRLSRISQVLNRCLNTFGHLDQYRVDQEKLNFVNTSTEGLNIFYYYTTSQLIVDIVKVLGEKRSDYYSLPKTLNHIESNLKKVSWMQLSYMSEESPRKSNDKFHWNKLITIRRKKTLRGDALKAKKDLIEECKNLLNEKKVLIEKLITARDQYLSHIDKNPEKAEPIQMTEIEELIQIGIQVFNKISFEIQGSTIQMKTEKKKSLLQPLNGFFEVKKLIRNTIAKNETCVSVEDLNKITQ